MSVPALTVIEALMRRAQEAGALSVVVTLTTAPGWNCALVGAAGDPVYVDHAVSPEAAVAEALARWQHPSRQVAS